MKNRTTIYAAFDRNGIPCINVWHFSKKRLDVWISDRIANGEALEGEHAVRIYVSYYNDVLRRNGMPEIAE